MRFARSSGCRAMTLSTQMGPLPSMNAVSTRIVTTAKIEFTMVRPASCRSPAASPAFVGRLRACSSRRAVTW